MAVDWDKAVSDWEVSTYADLGGGVLLAGYVSHFRFYSASLDQAVHGVYVGGGGGVGIGVNAHGIVQLAEKAAGATDTLPSAGMPLSGQCLHPFCVRQLIVCPVTIFNAGAAAGVALADIKWLQFGRFFRAQQAQATLKAAVEVGASWTAGSFFTISPYARGDLTVMIESRTRKRASDPLYLGGQKW